MTKTIGSQETLISNSIELRDDAKSMVTKKTAELALGKSKFDARVSLR